MAEITTVDPKNAILDAAEKLIAEHGYAGFSIRDLARDSSLAKGTLYYHFQDKLDIYRSVMQRALGRLEARLVEAAQTDAPPVQRLRQVVVVYLSLAYERRSLMLALLREFDNLEGDLRDMTHRSRETILAPIASLLHDGMRTGDFRHVPVEVAAMALFGTMNAYIGQQILLQDEPLEEQVIDQFLDFYLHGLVTTREKA